MRLPLPALDGRHQAANAGLALTLLNRMPGFAAADDHLTRALTEAEWPARMQRLTSGPWRAFLPRDAELLLDGGHNPSAAQAMAESLVADGKRPLQLVFAMLRSKDPEAFLRAFIPLKPQVWTVPVTGETPAFTPEELAAVAASCGLQAQPMNDVPQALKAIPRRNGHGPCVLICGTLYLAGAVLSANGPLPR